jgi:hypothetical protein
MHINLELLEASHLVAAMLLELPAMASALTRVECCVRADLCARQLNRTTPSDEWCRVRCVGSLITLNDRCVIDVCVLHRDVLRAGVHWPTRVDTRRDCGGVDGAHARRLASGAVTRVVRTAGANNVASQCAQLTASLACWSLFAQPAAFRALLCRLVQREALHTYLLAHTVAYDSVHIATLAKQVRTLCACAIPTHAHAHAALQFDLPVNEVHAFISRLTTRDELSAAWDQPSECLVMHRVEPTRLQLLSLQFAERAAAFVENNERLFDAKTGGHMFNDDAPNSKARIACVG